MSMVTDSTADWRHRAACRDVDPELFFPIGDDTAAYNAEQVEEAKSHCRPCPVVETCLRWALDTRQDAGVWGALSESERRALLRRRARARRTANAREAAGGARRAA